MPEVSDAELKQVIKDFLEQGFVENIVSMFKHEPMYYSWTGELLDDERLAVRLGMSVLFEELKIIQPNQLHRAVPSLIALLSSESPTMRGEALSILAIIATREARQAIRAMACDPSPQVRELVEILENEDLA